MRTAFVLIIMSALIGCGISVQSHAVDEDRLAKTELALEEVDTGAYRLIVHKDAIASGSEFLLSSSAIVADFGEPAFQGLLSRVVTFKRADGEVQMLESLKGNAVDPALIKPSILASFPILSDDATTVGLDFNEGMASLLLSYEWTSGPADPFYVAFRFDAATLTQRYVDDAKTDAAGRITVRQVAQADFGDLIRSTLELRYFLQPYAPDPTYEPLSLVQDYRWSGFLQSSSKLVPGTVGARNFVSRFHPDKPLAFAISANTPPAMRAAVADGILYWNRALGRDWIQVVDAPAGVTAPDLDYNLVQWVPERGAGFAYADGQLDPLTGQMQNAQIYFTSSFFEDAVNGIAYTHASLPRRDPPASPARSAPREDGEADDEADDARGAPARARFTGRCERVSERTFADLAKVSMQRGLSPEDIERTALDLVRSAIAHEIGHALGLEHNFAGSLGTNIAPQHSDPRMRAYFATGDWAEADLPGSSVMDYPSLEDDAAIGARIRLGHPALAYDELAVRSLYDGDGRVPVGGPLFCNDYEVYFSTGCAPYDRGADPVASLHDLIDDRVRNAAVEFVYWLRVPKAADVEDVFAATEPSFDAMFYGYAPRFEFAQLLTSGSRLLASDRAFGSPAINAEEIHEDSLARVGESVLAAGGYDAFFARLPRWFDRQFTEQLEQLLARPEHTSGISITGRPWAFTEEELESIRAYVPEYLAKYHQAAAEADVAVLSLQPPGVSSGSIVVLSEGGVLFESALPQWEPPVFEDELEGLLADRIVHYATATRGEFEAVVAATGPDGALVASEQTLPVFRYEPELRTAAASLLSASNSADRIWAYETRKAAYAEVEARINEAAGGDIYALSVDGSDPDAQRWILENQEVAGSYSGFSTQPGAGPGGLPGELPAAPPIE